jgi:hypothetical protein
LSAASLKKSSTFSHFLISKVIHEKVNSKMRFYPLTKQKQEKEGKCFAHGKD